MYHHSSHKNWLFILECIPIQSVRFHISKLLCGGRLCNRLISCLHHPHVLSGPLMPSSLFLAKSSPVVWPCPFSMVLYHRSSTCIKLSIASHPTVCPQY